jgi:hypothetical protein
MILAYGDYGLYTTHAIVLKMEDGSDLLPRLLSVSFSYFLDALHIAEKILF